MSKAMELEAVIGLEIHVQLKTKSKMFCPCDNASEGAQPNTLICPVCTGHPGTLPVPNKQAVAWAVMAAKALGCTVPEHAKFDRKHYVYPDLPKGYQISQYDEPIGVHGNLAILVDGKERTIGIERVHLEEDVGKLVHVSRESLVDFNRAGTPLMEIVTQPDLKSPEEARAFLHELRLTMRYLGVSDAEMEKGQLRCDANVSLKPKLTKKLFAKTELKNLNSFRSVERALRFEIERQHGLWQAGETPTVEETRGWDEAEQVTVAQRTKEGASDYRYFPEPDIPPLHFTPEFLAEIGAETPELPHDRRKRFMTLYKLESGEAERLVEDPVLAKYFEEVVSEYREYMENELGAQKTEKQWKHPELHTHAIASWLLNRIAAEHRASHGLPVPGSDLARLLWMVCQKRLTIATSVSVYEQMVLTKKGPHALMKELGAEQVSDTKVLEPIVRTILEENPKLVEQFRKGKTAVLQHLIGQVMKRTRGTADPNTVRSVLEKLLQH